MKHIKLRWLNMAIFSPKNIDILTEAYYGKKPEFKKIEELLEIIIQRCHNIKSGTGDIEINNSKELNQIESLFEKAFGMEEMHLTFYTISYGSIITSIKIKKVMGVNAYTYPSFTAYFKPKKDKQLTGDDLVCNVFIDVNLVTSLELTTGELMAIILHEIGHCYNGSFFAFLARIPIAFQYKEINDKILGTLYQSFGALIGDVYRSSTLITYIDRSLNSLITSNKQISAIVSNTIGILQNFFKLLSMKNPDILYVLN